MCFAKKFNITSKYKNPTFFKKISTMSNERRKTIPVTDRRRLFVHDVFDNN